MVAQRENGRVNGLHVARQNKAQSPAAQEAAQKALRHKFDVRCAAAGIPGELSIESGRITPTIAARAYWNDLVVMALYHPPRPRPR